MAPSPSRFAILAGLALAAAAVAAEAPFLADYDLATHQGVLVATDPAGKGLVLHRVPGRMLAEQVELTIAGRPAWLLCWQGFPQGTERFPELWVWEADRTLRMVWPPNPEFYWIGATVRTVKDEADPTGTYVEVRRELPPPALKGASAFTRERLALSLDGVRLVAKEAEPWRDERQLVALVEDLILTGELGRIEALVARHRETVGELGPGVQRHLLAMASAHALALGFTDVQLRAAGVPPAALESKEGAADATR